jgi:hypothetical protein
MKRFLLALTAFLALCAAPALAAPPTIDASGVTNTNLAATATSGTANVTTTSTNDAIIVAVMSQMAAAHGSAPVVSSITGCSLSFTKLTSIAVLGTTDAVNVDLEVWSAPSTSAQSACPLTVTLAADSDGTSVSTFGVHGLNNTSSPLDSNALAKSCVSAVASVPSSPTLTTTQANDLLVGFGFYAYASGPTAWTTSAWSLLYNYTDTATAYSNGSAGASYKGVTATQSGVSVDLTTTKTGEPAALCGLAFTADAAAASRPHTLLLLGVG